MATLLPMGMCVHLKGATAAGEGELFIGWSGDEWCPGARTYPPRRDTDSSNWSDWAQIYTSKDQSRRQCQRGSGGLR